MMPFKIIHIIASADPRSGGPIESILRFEEYTRGRLPACEHEIVTLDSVGSSWLDHYSIPIHALGMRADHKPSWIRPASRYRFSPKLRPWLKTNLPRFDIAIVHGLWSYASLASSLTLPRSKTAYFVFTHGMLDPWFRRRYPVKHVVKQLLWILEEGRLLSNARAVLFTCEEERRLARHTFFGHRYHERVVSFGSSPPPKTANAANVSFAWQSGVEPGPFLLFLGRIHPKKGCDLLIRAFANVATLRPELKLVIAGPCSSDWGIKLRQLAHECGASERIYFSDGLFGDLKWQALSRAEAFILPSHQENFGIAVTEALSCGTPVLISDKVNIWREIIKGGAGLAEEDTIEGTQKMLLKWFAIDDDEKMEMGRLAVELFSNSFDVSSTAPRLLETLVSLSKMTH